jgi:hypothetical protein
MKVGVSCHQSVSPPQYHNKKCYSFMAHISVPQPGTSTICCEAHGFVYVLSEVGVNEFNDHHYPLKVGKRLLME